MFYGAEAQSPTACKNRVKFISLQENVNLFPEITLKVSNFVTKRKQLSNEMRIQIRFSVWLQQNELRTIQVVDR